MQLFITAHYKQDKNNITITDERIVHQCFHVLRYKVNQTIQIQDKSIRYTLEIITISKKEIQTTIQKEQIIESTYKKQTTFIIALPNRRDKAELIVQKLTEIGIENIMFWKADKSILRDFSDKKLQRLETISLEAAEQSFRRTVPTITYLDNLFENPILSSGQIILFHQNGKTVESIKSQEISRNIVSIVGPEGGFSKKELERFTHLSHDMITLGDTILRMETATIIGARIINNI